MKLHELSPAPGAKSKKKRLGRGQGSGLGKTSGKGHKGLLARSGRANQVGFEGGQIPLVRRLPKRGFNNVFKVEYVVVNLKKLASLQDVDTITPAILKQKNIIKGRNPLVKILGVGEVGRPMIIEAHCFSESAKEKIEKSGGQARVIGRA
ncbi:MAG: 50S ribosomal protein L15 [Nitrospira sp.]|nr:50S ribosomal protein L15 [Nitrospira sp.]MCB9709952.1 50S ribosomal protein L15 [Nitrospiraceae bacterium]MDR4487174.1 50S ribosomal protein L15 [Nitrospirales bacterium]MCA9465382.1 50S ribosomal protein L15 [Nitrospira sp.]MCA9474627.1 50S ribosomal protein L15 [Nitrospira sp.]